MIRIDSIWLGTEPMDMLAGAETAVAVGMAVTCHPPAQIRTCGITAYGSCLGF
jgi:hypothetical protein